MADTGAVGRLEKEVQELRATYERATAEHEEAAGEVAVYAERLQRLADEEADAYLGNVSGEVVGRQRDELAAARDEAAGKRDRLARILPELGERLRALEGGLASERRAAAVQRAEDALRARESAAQGFGADPGMQTLAPFQLARDEAEKAVRALEQHGVHRRELGELLDEPAWKGDDADMVADAFEQAAQVLRQGPVTPHADRVRDAEASERRRRQEEDAMVAKAARDVLALGDSLPIEGLPPHLRARALELARALRAERKAQADAFVDPHDDSFPQMLPGRRIPKPVHMVGEATVSR